MKFFAILLLSFLFSLASYAGDSRAPFIYKLIYESSAAKHIEMNGTLEAKMKHQSAKNTYKSAQDAAANGNNDEEKRLLNLSVKEMQEAVHLSKLPDDILKKQKEDYLRKKDSVVSFIDALKRVSQEKNRVEEAKVVLVTVNEKVALAEFMAAKNSFETGKKSLDEAFELLKTNLVALRDGDTLTRDLNFKTAEEAFAYHRGVVNSMSLLVEVFMGDREMSDQSRRMLQEVLVKANKATADADKLAERKDFEAALERLEDAKNELRKAAGMIGIYIPR